MRICITLIAIAAMFVGLFCQLPPASPAATTAPTTTTTTNPDLWNQLQCPKRKATFEFWQDDKLVKRDDDGILHLAPRSFEIRIAGDVDNVFLLTSTKPGFAKALREAKNPLAILEATGCAYGEGDILVQESAGLATWDEAKKWIFADDEDGVRAEEAALRQVFGEIPVLSATGVQFVATFAPDNARDYRFVVSNVVMCEGTLFDHSDTKPVEMKLDKIKHLTMAVCLQSPVATKAVFGADWRIVTLSFDAK